MTRKTSRVITGADHKRRKRDEWKAAQYASTAPRVYRSDRERYDAAMRYAEADKSDPFVKMRVLSHMRNGLCGFIHDSKDGFYEAEIVKERRSINLGNGQTLEWEADAYKNRARP